MIRIFLACLLSIAVATPSLGQDGSATRITAQQRSDVIRALGVQMKANYVFPETAETVAVELDERRASGAYDTADDAKTFADALREDLRAIGDDRHLQVRYRPDFEPYASDDRDSHSAEEMAEMKRFAESEAYGVPTVRRLPGNIGYIAVTGFWMPEYVAPAYEAAMKLASGSDALIIDLRGNGGGDPEAVAQLMSHFFAPGDVRHINSIYERTQDSTRDFYTDRTVETRFTSPVYVLTSGRTFSGGEEFAYDMQTQKRATLIGETTGGGANPGGMYELAHGFVAFIPTGRAINPVTGTNWEHVGVVPDREMPASEAMTAAYISALEELSSAGGEDTERDNRASLIERAKAGQLDLPVWDDPRP